MTIFCFVFAGLDAAKADELASYKGWWAQFMKDPEDDKELLNVELGNKMVLLMDILKESYLIGDKVLVFSQSLLSLDLIEKFLSIAAFDDTYGTWNHGKDYFRMDGSTGPDVRKKWCSYFNNKKNNDMRLFLISTKAGKYMKSTFGPQNCARFFSSKHKVQCWIP